MVEHISIHADSVITGWNYDSYSSPSGNERHESGIDSNVSFHLEMDSSTAAGRESPIVTSSDSILYRFSFSDHPQGGVHNFLEQIVIGIDYNRQTLSLYAQHEEGYGGQFDLSTYGSSLSITNAPFVLASNHDSITIILDSLALINTKFNIRNYSERSAPRDWSTSVSSGVVGIRKGGYIRIQITGIDFPSPVESVGIQRISLDRLAVDPVTNLLIIPSALNSRVECCYDVLGRIYPLQLVKISDGATFYSLRNLSPGLHFVRSSDRVGIFIVR